MSDLDRDLIAALDHAVAGRWAEAAALAAIRAAVTSDAEQPLG